MSALSAEEQHELRREYCARVGEVLSALNPKVKTGEHAAILTFALLELAHLVALSSLNVEARHAECEAGETWAHEAMASIMESAARTAGAL